MEKEQHVRGQCKGSIADCLAIRSSSNSARHPLSWYVLHDSVRKTSIGQQTDTEQLRDCDAVLTFSAFGL
eukprot:COSAG02_NODE_1576_length_11868_cov_82.967117_6_plen_70_part_00